MKRLGYLLFLAVAFLQVACVKNENSLVGQYQSTYPNIFIRFLNQDKAWSGKSELVLIADSSFYYASCGNVMTGRWTATADSLYLWAKTNDWRHYINEEMGRAPRIDTTKAMVYAIKNDALENQFTSIDSSGERILIELLVKERDE